MHVLQCDTPVTVMDVNMSLHCVLFPEWRLLLLLLEVLLQWSVHSTHGKVIRNSWTVPESVSLSLLPGFIFDSVCLLEAALRLRLKIPLCEWLCLCLLSIMKCV